MTDILMKEIETEIELKDVLELCYKVLGTRTDELYGYNAWYERWQNGLQPLVYAQKEGQVVSAVLGRAENEESLVIGFVACDEAYQRQGITKRLLEYFEKIAVKKGSNILLWVQRKMPFMRNVVTRSFFKYMGKTSIKKNCKIRTFKLLYLGEQHEQLQQLH